jgi:CHAT domain-containing protein
MTDHEITYAPSASAMQKLTHQMIPQSANHKIAIFADPVFEPDDHRVAHHAKQSPTSRSAQAMESSLRTRTVITDVRGAETARITRLPYSRREAEQILQFFLPDATMRALDFDASRRRVMSLDLSSYRIVHFATHGFMDSMHPELSGIVMSMVDEHGLAQDGFLTLADISGLRLSADIVVLSACETALGKEVKGEGLIGLAQAFMSAGAASVMASLWKVDDIATAELMKRFYTALIGNHVTPSEALRTAQLQMRQDKRWSQPYYWAGFLLEGAER